MERILFFIGPAVVEIAGPPAGAPAAAETAGGLDAALRALAARRPGGTVRTVVGRLSAAGAGALVDAAAGAAGRADGPRRVRIAARGPAAFRTLAREAERRLASMARKTFRNPIPTVDIIVSAPGGVVLVRRKNPPFGWALPGGFVEYGESLEEAAVRECREETGLRLSGLRQFRAYSRPDRDPRIHTISTVFAARGRGTPRAADDALELGIFPRPGLPAPLAFDHAAILADWFAAADRNPKVKEF